MLSHPLSEHAARTDTGCSDSMDSGAEKEGREKKKPTKRRADTLLLLGDVIIYDVLLLQ